jgi:hypothetical protein
MEEIGWECRSLEEWPDIKEKVGQEDEVIEEIVEHAFLDLMEIDLGMETKMTETPGFEEDEEMAAHVELDLLLDSLEPNRKNEDRMETEDEVIDVDDDKCDKTAYCGQGPWLLDRWLRKKNVPLPSTRSGGRGENMAVGVFNHSQLCARIVCGSRGVPETLAMLIVLQDWPTHQDVKYKDNAIYNSGKRKRNRKAGSWCPSSSPSTQPTGTGTSTGRRRLRAGRRRTNDKDIESYTHWARPLNILGAAGKITVADFEYEGQDREQVDGPKDIQEQSIMQVAGHTVIKRATLCSGKPSLIQDNVNCLAGKHAGAAGDPHGESSGQAGGGLHQRAGGGGGGRDGLLASQQCDGDVLDDEGWQEGRTGETGSQADLARGAGQK